MSAPAPTPGRLIVLEGPDGVGKSTVATELARILQAAGRDARIVTASRGASAWARRLNEAIHDRGGTDLPDPLAFQLAAAAAARDGYARQITPLLAAGVDVICDRIHAVSSLIYGRIAGANPDDLEPIVTVTRPPEARWFVLAVPWSVLRDRRPPGDDVWDRRGDDFAALVAGAYDALTMAGSELEDDIRRLTGWGPAVPINAIAAPRDVAAQIARHLEAPAASAPPTPAAAARPFSALVSYGDDDGHFRPLGDPVTGSATTTAEAQRIALDARWDDRLDAAGCPARVAVAWLDTNTREGLDPDAPADEDDAGEGEGEDGALNLCERGNTLLVDEDGNMQAFLRLDGDRYLVVAYRPENYPALYVQTLRTSDDELAARLARDYAGWIATRCHLDGVVGRDGLVLSLPGNDEDWGDGEDEEAIDP